MITITERAKKEVRDVLKEQGLSKDTTYLRVKILGSGCV